MTDQRSNSVRRTKYLTAARKSVVKLIELQRLVEECCEILYVFVLLNQLGLPNLETRRNHQLNTLMYKVRHEIVPSSLSDKFKKNE